MTVNAVNCSDTRCGHKQLLVAGAKGSQQTIGQMAEYSPTNDMLYIHINNQPVFFFFFFFKAAAVLIRLLNASINRKVVIV